MENVNKSNTSGPCALYCPDIDDTVSVCQSVWPLICKRREVTVINTTNICHLDKIYVTNKSSEIVFSRIKKTYRTRNCLAQLVCAVLTCLTWILQIALIKMCRRCNMSFPPWHMQRDILQCDVHCTIWWVYILSTLSTMTCAMCNETSPPWN